MGSELALRYISSGMDGQRVRSLNVLVLGCGLSPLVFALADKGKWTVRCVELSSKLVEHLQVAASTVPRPPAFEVGDVTTAAAEAVSDDSDNNDGIYTNSDNGEGRVPGSPLSRRGGGADLVIDENVLDGMGCTFPIEAGVEQQRRALVGIARLLRPGGALLTLSFLPLDRSPHLHLFEGWYPLDFDAAAAMYRGSSVHQAGY